MENLYPQAKFTCIAVHIKTGFPEIISLLFVVTIKTSCLIGKEYFEFKNEMTTLKKTKIKALYEKTLFNIDCFTLPVFFDFFICLQQ
jgi:hypothetical protein